MRVVVGTADVDDVDDFVASLDEVAEATGATVQAFDARYVVGRSHLERAVELADRAFERGENVARERSVEILLYAAGRRQIRQALRMGVDEGRSRTVVLVDGGDADAAADAVAALLEDARVDPPALEEFDPERVRSFFDVTDAELTAVDGGLADVVRERVALLDVEK